MYANSLGFNKILGVQAVAEGVDLEAHEGAASQSDLRVGSVFLGVKWGFVSLSDSLAGEYGLIKGNKLDQGIC